MRKLAHTIKAALLVFGAALCAAVMLILLLSPVFPKGERYELYLGASSSARCVESDDPFLDKLRYGGVRGESVYYTGDRADELFSRYHARVLLVENACGVTNYYCYSPVLKGCVRVRGYLINLHVAVSETQTVAGTPIIFGGF